MHGGLPHGVRVHVSDDDDRVVGARAGEGRVEVLREHQDRVVVAPVHAQVAQLAQRGMRAADLVEAGEVRGERAPPSASALAQSRTLYSYFSLSMFSSEPGRATFSMSS